MLIFFLHRWPPTLQEDMIYGFKSHALHHLKVLFKKCICDYISLHHCSCLHFSTGKVQ